MGAQIELGVDIDTHPVNTFESSVDKLDASVRQLDLSFQRLAKASTDVDRRMRGIADAQGMAEKRTAAAVAQMSRMEQTLSGVRNAAVAAGGILGTFIGASLVSNMVGFAQELERIERTFTTVTGSAAAARAEMDYVDAAARRLGQGVGAASDAYAKLLASASASQIPLEDTRSVFEGLTAASSALGLSQQDFQGALLAMSQIMSKGTVSAEELRGQIGERLPGAFAIAADAVGMTMAELGKALESGALSARDFVGLFGRELERRFESTAESADGFTRSVRDLQNAARDLGVALVEGGAVDAMTDVARIMTDIASSEAAVATMNALGGSLRFVAEHGEASAIAIGTLTAALSATTLGRAVGAITALGGYLSALADRTVEVGDSQVALGAIWAAEWSGIVAEVQAAGQLIVAVWDYIATSASVIPARLAQVWAQARSDFAAFAQGIAATWSNLLSSIADIAASVPEFLTGDLVGKLRAGAADAAGVVTTLGDAVVRAEADIANANKTIEQTGAAWKGVEQAAANYTAVVKDSGVLTAQQRAAEQTEAQRVETEKINRLKGIQSEADREIAASSRDIEASTGGISGNLGKAGGGAARVADELKRAKEVLSDQVREHQRVLDLWTGIGTETDFVSKEMAKLVDALDKSGVSLDDFLRTMGMTRDEYTAMLRETEKFTAQLERQRDMAADIAKVLSGIAFGQVDIGQGAGDIITTLTEGAWGEQLDKAFEDVADTLAKSFQDAIGGLGGLGLSDTAMAGVGTGIGMAAVGAINGNVQQIGSGLGSAAGAVLGESFLGFLGTAAGPVGMILGGLAGSALSGLFGGGRDYIQPTGTAFQGTAIERQVTALEAFPDEEGNTSAAHVAYAGVVEVVKDFEDIINKLVKDTTASAKRMQVDLRDGIDVMKAVDKITLEMDRRPTSSISKGSEERAAFFEQRMLEIVGIAEQIATVGSQPLTEAQRQWREFSDQFSKENIEILKAIGFSAKEIREAQAEIQRGLVDDFNKEMLDSLVDTGEATKRQLELWKQDELELLIERRTQALRTAREIGASEDLVRANFAAQAKGIRSEFKDMLDDMVEDVVEAASRIDRLQFRGGVLDELVSDGANDTTAREWFRVNREILQAQRHEQVAEAKRLGVDVEAVNKLYRQRLRQLEREFGELRVKDAQEVVERISRMERLQFRGGLADTIAGEDASRGELRDWLRVNKAILEEQRQEQVKEAKRLGVDVALVNRAYRQQLLDLEKEFNERRVRDTKDAIEKITRMERLQFKGGLMDTVAGEGAGEGALRDWLRVNKAILEEQRQEQVKEAKRLGVDVALVNRAYRRQLLDLEKEFNQRRHADAVNAAQKTIDRLNERMNRVESRRAEILTELARRAEDARRAEEALGEARRNLAVSDLAPGGPLDQLKALQQQFSAAIKAAQGGDAEAAQRAAGLAGSLLQQGQQVYASGGNYVDLFKSVNQQLLSAQGKFDTRADRIEKNLDADTFSKVSEKNTGALLKALGVQNETLKEIRQELRLNNKRLDNVEQKQRVRG